MDSFRSRTRLNEDVQLLYEIIRHVWQAGGKIFEYYMGDLTRKREHLPFLLHGGLFSLQVWHWFIAACPRWHLSIRGEVLNATQSPRKKGEKPTIFLTFNRICLITNVISV